MFDFQTIQTDRHSRRAFFQRMTAAGLGLAAIQLLEGCGGGHNNSGLSGGGGSFPVRSVAGRNDNEQVLNYALTLEHLEADLYRQALNIASGKSPAAPLAATPSSYSLAVSSGGLSGSDATDGFEYLRQFAFVEAAHRDFLITTLNMMGAPITAHNPKGYKFATAVPAGTDLKTLLSNILPLESTGVRAYLGAAPYLDSLSIATTATEIFSTEARHTAAISYLIEPDRNPGPAKKAGDRMVTATYPHENTFEYFLPPSTVISNIQPFLVK